MGVLGGRCRRRGQVGLKSDDVRTAGTGCSTPRPWSSTFPQAEHVFIDGIASFGRVSLRMYRATYAGNMG